MEWLELTASPSIADLNSRPPYSTGTLLTPQYYLAELATPAEIEVLVSQRDFEAALAEVRSPCTHCCWGSLLTFFMYSSCPVSRRPRCSITRRSSGDSPPRR